MKTIAIIILSAICIILSISCSNQKSKTVAKLVDSTLYVTKDIKLYANIDTLLAHGIISPSTNIEAEYVCNNNTFNNIKFQEAGVNYYHSNSKIVNNIAFAQLLPIDSIQRFFSKMYQILYTKYQKPDRTIHFNTKQDDSNFTNTVWIKKKMVIILACIVPNGENGAVNVIFTTPKDTINFESLMH